MTLWSTGWGHRVGTDHVERGCNRQDAAWAACCEGAAFGLVSDGCGEGSASEVGALLSVRTAARVLCELEPAVELARVPQLVLAQVTQALGAVLHAVAPREVESFVADYLCATLLGFVVRGSEAVLFACGDGLFVVDGEVEILAADNRPSYPAYGLLGGRVELRTRLCTVRSNLAVASDGVEPGFFADVGRLRGRLLTRHLVLAARRGQLTDDGAIAVAQLHAGERW